MRGFASLASALAASVALHAGGAALCDALLANMAPAAKSPPPRLHATLAGTPPPPAPYRPQADGGRQGPGDADGRSALAPPLPRYFAPHELDRKPEAVGEVPLAYPADMPLVARARVVLSLLIDERGTVDRVIVEAAETPAELAQLALRAFAGARFTPGMRDGVAVKSRLRVEVIFEGG